MAPGFFRKLFTKIKDGAKKVFDFGKKAVKTLVDVVPKVAPAVAPVIDKLIPGSGAAIQGLSSGLQALQPIFKNGKGGGAVGAYPTPEQFELSRKSKQHAKDNAFLS